MVVKVLLGKLSDNITSKYISKIKEKSTYGKGVIDKPTNIMGDF